MIALPITTAATETADDLLAEVESRPAEGAGRALREVTAPAPIAAPAAASSAHARGRVWTWARGRRAARARAAAIAAGSSTAAGGPAPVSAPPATPSGDDPRER